MSTELDPLKISRSELDAKVNQLNLDLAPLAEQIGQLLFRFNTETGGHAADVSVDLDWHGKVPTGNQFGIWLLAKMDLVAKEKRLPRDRRF